MEKNIQSLEELYNYIKPALYSKTLELKRLGIDYVKEEDIWNYLSVNDWSHGKDLKIFDMVSSIMNLETDKINNYVINLLKHSNRELIKREEDLL